MGRRNKEDLTKEPAMKAVYLDHASATPVRKEVLEAMLPYFNQTFASKGDKLDGSIFR